MAYCPSIMHTATSRAALTPSSAGRVYTPVREMSGGEVKCQEPHLSTCPSQSCRCACRTGQRSGPGRRAVRATRAPRAMCHPSRTLRRRPSAAPTRPVRRSRPVSRLSAAQTSNNTHQSAVLERVCVEEHEERAGEGQIQHDRPAQVDQVEPDRERG